MNKPFSCPPHLRCASSTLRSDAPFPFNANETRPYLDAHRLHSVRQIWKQNVNICVFVFGTSFSLSFVPSCPFWTEKKSHFSIITIIVFIYMFLCSCGDLLQFIQGYLYLYAMCHREEVVAIRPLGRQHIEHQSRPNNEALKIDVFFFLSIAIRMWMHSLWILSGTRARCILSTMHILAYRRWECIHQSSSAVCVYWI